jgi:hypothetical protein
MVRRRSVAKRAAFDKIFALKSELAEGICQDGKFSGVRVENVKEQLSYELGYEFGLSNHFWSGNSWTTGVVNSGSGLDSVCKMSAIYFQLPKVTSSHTLAF